MGRTVIGHERSGCTSTLPRLEDACHGFDLERMAANNPEVRRNCLDVSGHERKIDAILETAETVRMLGDVGLGKALLDLEPFLRSLPYIGPVTWRHLAKNIGVSVAKADRHMVRLPPQPDAMTSTACAQRSRSGWATRSP